MNKKTEEHEPRRRIGANDWQEALLMSTPAARRAVIDDPIANAASVLSAVDGFMQERGLSQQQVARKAGFSTTYLSQLLSDWREDRFGRGDERIPPSTRNEIVEKLDRWLEDAVHIQRRTEADTALPTAVARMVTDFARRIKHQLCFGVVIGGSGMGKTVAIRYAARQIPGTITIEAGEFCQRPREILRWICTSDPNVFRRTGGENTWARQRADAVHYRLAGAVLKDTDRLLFVDEAHKLESRGMEFLRQINEQWRLPIVLVGTVKIRRRISDDADPHFGQMSSRIGAWLDLVREFGVDGGRGRRKLATTEEIATLAKRRKLRLVREALRSLVDVANRDTGHFRRVDNTLYNCWLMAHGLEADAEGMRDIDEDIYRLALQTARGSEIDAPADLAADDLEDAKSQRKAATA